MYNCIFDNPVFTFGGPAVATINTFKALYADPGFRPLIEDIFKVIRGGGNFPKAIPPSDAADG